MDASTAGASALDIVRALANLEDGPPTYDSSVTLEEHCGLCGEPSAGDGRSLALHLKSCEWRQAVELLQKLGEIPAPVIERFVIVGNRHADGSVSITAVRHADITETVERDIGSVATGISIEATGVFPQRFAGESLRGALHAVARAWDR